MPRYGMVIDLTKCVGCNACTVACQMEWGLESYEHWIRVLSSEDGIYPAVTRRFLPVQCMHCERPTCVSVCPTGASYKRRDGLVLIDQDRCIGCKYCMVGCPYQARIFNKKIGVPEKCRFCVHRIAKGVTPACVMACPVEARTFGDISDPASEVSRLIIQRKAAQLRPDLGNVPNIYYIR
ncbi:MAG: 4Fe-4S dicluster domain-containing protein [Chloroflexi bacterium]|nr:4Fe-4S dicluster domain-containing protein [Chloroflexota bacterium]